MQISTKSNLIYKVKKNDTINTICQRFKIDEQQLKLLNKCTEIKQNDILLLPKPYNYVYVVKPLDSYENIAKTLGVSIETITKVTKGKKMYIGQKICF